MKRFFLAFIILVTFIFSYACGTKEKEGKYISDKNNFQCEIEEINNINGGYVASDGEKIYMLDNAEGLIYYLDFEKMMMTINCSDLMCIHKGSECSAKLPISDYCDYSLRRNNGKVYALGERIFEISDNKKDEISNKQYGYWGNQIVFGDYIAYFDEQDVVVVEEIETNTKVQRFEDITGFAQGNFYYKDCLYFITAELQLIQLDLITGEKTVLEEKGASRASVYRDYIYYIKVSEETNTNYLIKMNPFTFEKEILLEGVFYYNMLGERIYYSTYPDKELWNSDIKGQDKKLIDKTQKFGWIWTFEQDKKILIEGPEVYTFYVLEDNQELNYENLLKIETGE